MSAGSVAIGGLGSRQPRTSQGRHGAEENPSPEEPARLDKVGQTVLSLSWWGGAILVSLACVGDGDSDVRQRGGKARKLQKIPGDEEE